MPRDGQTEGQTDMLKLTVTFRNFPHAPNKIIFTGRSNRTVSAISDENVGSVSRDIYVYHPQEWTRIKQGVRKDIMSGKNSMAYKAFV